MSKAFKTQVKHCCLLQTILEPEFDVRVAVITQTHI